MHDRACVGDRANIYSLGPVELGPECTVAQECYLCTGTHDFEKTMFLMTSKITVGARAFLGARTFDEAGDRGRLLARAHPSGQWIEWLASGPFGGP